MSHKQSKYLPSISLHTISTFLASCISYSFPDYFDTTSCQIMDSIQSLALVPDFICILNIKSANTSQKSVGMTGQLSYLKA